MARRTGIDLSSANAALVHVQEGKRGPQLLGFVLVDAAGDLDAIAAELRHARKQYALPRRAEVVAWPGEPRAEAASRAGFTVERIISPPDALARVARLHAGTQASDTVTAVVALHLDSGALAIVRDGEVLHEAALAWSAASASTASLPGRSELLRRYAFLSELTEYMRAAFAAVRRSHGVVVTDIKTCGSLPDLRSLTMPLADEFDLEVEALDATDAFEIRMTPESAARANDVVASLQVALAAGRRWRHSRGVLDRLLHRSTWVPVAAALAAALLLAIYLWPTSPAPTRPSPPVSRAALPSSRDRSVSMTRGGEAGPPEAVGTAAKSSEPAAIPLPPAPVPEAQKRPAAAARGAKPTAPSTGSNPAKTQVAPVKPLPPPTASPVRPVAPAARVPERSRAKSRPEQLPSEGPRRAPSDRLPPAPLEVTSILWSADRKLAVIGGRIVGVGDTIEGLEIVEVQQDAVIVRDSAGRLRRAALGGEQKP